MAVHNADIAAQFNRMADLLEIEGANPFRVRAYRRAAGTIEDLPESIADMLAAGKKLEELPGIGADLAGKIREICETGRLKALAEVEARTPSTLAALTAIPGLGPKRVQQLHEKLGIETVADLVKAARAGRLRELPRFSAAMEAKLLKEIEAGKQAEQRFKISVAEDFAEGLMAHLRQGPGIGKAVVAGSFRRRKDTVGDIDILVTCSNGAAAIAHFVGYDEVAKVIAKGDTRATVALKAGVQVDLRVVPEESYGAALHYFTGSKSHNIAVRKIAQAKGLKLNEYGIFRGTKRVGGATEEEVFKAAGLPYIEPELREDRGEIEAAIEARLPHLVALADIKGDLHVHTRESDGKSSLAEMAEAARERGYEYLGIADHSRHATVAHGLDPKRLSAELDRIDRLNETLQGITLLKSCEVDILADGRLDLPDSILRRLDYTVCAVHYRFELDRKAQTERILRAMDNRYFTVLAHPTGRLLGERPGYQVDLELVMEAAKERGCFLEINGHPSRLDLDDVHARAAKNLGIKVVISTDAHSTVGLSAMRFGVDQARRGWLEPGNVLNTLPLPKLRKAFAR
jgi:DNA polymerase (family 10)